MKTQVLTLVGTVVAAGLAQASADYGPAIWNPACSGHWYTGGYGHKFHVVHDMEGYYASTISYFKNCGTSASVHYCVNGKQDATSDAPAGEITQMVLEANYAWHALCWNQHSTGTEHEGFASNPAWYTTAQYNASAGITAHEATKFGYAKDRNHIVAHGQKSVPGWSTWASANLGINPNCNTHTDPGPNWDWTYYMNQVTGGGGTATIVDNSSANFSVTGTWATGSSATDKYGADYRYHSTAPISEPAKWTASVSGTKSVYVWYPQGSNRSVSASYIITTSGGNHTEVVNQQITGGTWVNQGSYALAASGNYVELSCWTATGFIVVADAVKWQ